MRERERQHAHQVAYFNKAYSRIEAYQLENWRQSYIRRAFSALGLKPRLRPGFSYLDVGIGGMGYTVIEAARLGATAWGVDLSEVGVESARRLSGQALPPAAARRCRFKVSPAEALPFKDGSFDAISCIAVLEHIPDHAKALAEMARVCKPGGRVFISAPHRLSRTPWLMVPMTWVNDRMVGHLRHYSRDGLRALGAGMGLAEHRAEYHVHLVKLWQLLRGYLSKDFNRNSSPAWWAMEQADLDAWQDDHAAMISMTFTKQRAPRRTGRRG